VGKWRKIVKLIFKIQRGLKMVTQQANAGKGISHKQKFTIDTDEPPILAGEGKLNFRLFMTLFAMELPLIFTSRKNKLHIYFVG
jgi:hypothetical protein